MHLVSLAVHIDHNLLRGGRRQMAISKRVGGGATVTWTGKPLLISKKKKKKGTARRRRNNNNNNKAMTYVERKIKVLQELVPHGASMELEGLFRQAANYIVCLQVQVKVMQILLGESSPPLDSDD